MVGATARKVVDGVPYVARWRKLDPNVDHHFLYIRTSVQCAAEGKIIAGSRLQSLTHEDCDTRIYMHATVVRGRTVIRTRNRHKKLYSIRFTKANLVLITILCPPVIE